MKLSCFQTIFESFRKKDEILLDSRHYFQKLSVIPVLGGGKGNFVKEKCSCFLVLCLFGFEALILNFFFPSELN